MTDPYETLGIDRDASEDDVRRAYRHQAKRTHPDVEGGSREAFDEVSRSMVLLTDKKRREHYDQTGEWQPNDPENPLSGPISILMSFFDDVVTQWVAGQGQDPTKVDLIHHGTRVVSDKLTMLKSTKAMAERHVGMIEKVASRLAAKNGAPHLQQALKWQIDQIKGQIAPVVDDIKRHEQALAMLADHTFTFDAVPPGIYQPPIQQQQSPQGPGSMNGGFFTWGGR